MPPMPARRFLDQPRSGTRRWHRPRKGVEQTPLRVPLALKLEMRASVERPDHLTGIDPDTKIKAPLPCRIAFAVQVFESTEHKPMAARQAREACFSSLSGGPKTTRRLPPCILSSTRPLQRGNPKPVGDKGSSSRRNAQEQATP